MRERLDRSEEFPDVGDTDFDADPADDIRAAYPDCSGVSATTPPGYADASDDFPGEVPRDLLGDVEEARGAQDVPRTGDGTTVKAFNVGSMKALERSGRDLGCLTDPVKDAQRRRAEAEAAPLTLPTFVVRALRLFFTGDMYPKIPAPPPDGKKHIRLP